MISEKRFLSETDVLAEGLRLLQARETLRAEVRKGFDQLDDRQGIPVEDAFRSAEERIRQIEFGKA